MTKSEKREQAIRENPTQTRFPDLDTLLRSYGFLRSQPRGGSSHYIWKGPLSLYGVSVGVSAMRIGRANLSAGLTFFPVQSENGGAFTLNPPNPSLELQTGLGARVYLMPTMRRAAWTLAFGPGVEATYAIFVFRSSSSIVPIVPSWFGPAIAASVRRDVGHVGFVQLLAGAEYDLLGLAPGPLTIKAQLSAGTAF